MKVLIDTCVWSGAKQVLEDAGYDCVWVGDFLNDPGDEAIMNLAFHEGRVIITLDKDFGELAVFKGIPHYGIIRLAGFSALRQGEMAVSVLRSYTHDLALKAIITVDKNKVRIRVG